MQRYCSVDFQSRCKHTTVERLSVIGSIPPIFLPEISSAPPPHPPPLPHHHHPSTPTLILAVWLRLPYLISRQGALMEFNLLTYVEWSWLGHRLCDEYTNLIPLVHSFRFDQLCFSLHNDDLAGVSRPSHLSNSTGAGTRAISAPLVEAEPNVKRIVCQHGRTVQTAQGIDFSLSVPNTACYISELCPPANERPPFGLRSRRREQRSQGTVTLEQRQG